MVAHAFNSSTREAEAGGFLSSRPAWSTKWVPGQPGLHRETLSRKTKQNKTKQNKTCICMHVCTSVCMYMHACVHICVHVYACMCAHLCACICMHVCTSVCLYMYACVHICVHVYVCMYAHLCACICMHVCTYMWKPEDDDLPWMPFFRNHATYFWDRVFYWVPGLLIRLTDWPLNLWDLPVSAVPELGLQAHTVLPGFLHGSFPVKSDAPV
jgi:hypothetical protein